MGGCCYREHDQVPPVSESQPTTSTPSKHPNTLPASQLLTSPSLPEFTTAQKFRRAVNTVLVTRRSSHSHMKVHEGGMETAARRASLQSNLSFSNSHYIKKLSDSFETLYQRSKETISKTTACQVYLAEYLPTGQKCLVKQLNKKGTAKDMHENRTCAAEAGAWVDIFHPCLARVLEVIQDEHCFYVVSEACGGTLIAERRKAATEGWAGCVLFQVLSMLRTVHSAGRLHLAIAPDTIWLVENQGNPVVKVQNPLSIPGLVHAKGKEFAQTEAPEKEKTEKSDVWSCGIVLYFLLSCELPYTSDTYHQLLSSKHKPEIAFSYFWNHINPEAKSLVSRMLSALPASRPSVQECLLDPGIASHHPSIPTKVLDHTVKQLLAARTITPVKAAVLNFLLARVMKDSELAAYAEAFEALDTDGSGTLTPEKLKTGLERLMPPATAAEKVTRITAALQPDANNTINYHQYLLSAIDQHALFSHENLRLAFAHFDSDHNGTISASELKASLFGNSPQSESLWKELSHRAALRDGVVTFREFVDMINAIC